MKAAIASLSPSDIAQLENDWQFIARDEQLPPPGDWVYWTYMAGRGSGKTHSGAAWVNETAYRNPGAIGHIVAPTSSDIEKVMVGGPFGILAVSRPEFVPEYIASKNKLIWPNGTIAYTFSAEKPDRLRGPQCNFGWIDELAAWQRLEETWDQFQFGYRLKPKLGCLITTTPRPITLIRKLTREFVDQGLAVVTRGTTYDNRANLDPDFFNSIITKYEGTRLGRQELNAEILGDNPDALWNLDQLDRLRVDAAPKELRKVAVALDPPTTSGENADEAGIVVAGLAGNGHGYVLADYSGQGMTPQQWAQKTVNAYHAFQADCVIAEVNQGGEMVKAMLSNIDRTVPVRMVHAKRGKYIRAEPVAALYEQCIAAGQMVEAERGSVPIETIMPGEKVWTRSGLKPVLWSGQTGFKEVLQLKYAGGVLECTEDHPVWCGRGFVSAGNLVPGQDKLLSWQDFQNSHASNVRLQFGTPAADADHAGLKRGGKLDRQSVVSRYWMGFGSTSRKAGIGEHPSMLGTCFSIGLYGKKKLAQFLMGSISTIWTETLQIMNSPILFASVQVTTQPSIEMNSSLRFRRRKLGKKCPKVYAGHGQTESLRRMFAGIVGQISKARVQKQDFAARNVTRGSGLTGVEKTGKLCKVYNLHVEGCHEYFAGGVLVHNCKVHHVGIFSKLEDQQCDFVPDFDVKASGYSPDRVDALVYALTHLMVKPFEAGIIAATY